MRWKWHRWVAICLVGLGAYVGFKEIFLWEKGPTTEDLGDSLEEIIALTEVGETKEALRRLDQLQAVSAVSLEARALKASLLVESDPAQARELANTLLDKPLSDEATDRAVSLWVKLEEPELARETLGEVPEDQPLSLRRNLAAAKVALYADRDGVKAMGFLENAFRLDPEHIETRQMLARLLFASPNIIDQVRAKSLTRELSEEGRVPMSLLTQILFNQNTPLFTEELSDYTVQLLDHPSFESSPFARDMEFYRVVSSRLRMIGDEDLLWRIDTARIALPEATRNDISEYLATALLTSKLSELEMDAEAFEQRLPGDPRVDLLRAVRAYEMEKNDEALAWVVRAMSKGEPAAVLTEAVSYLSKAAPLPSEMAIKLAEYLIETEGVQPQAALVGANTLLANAPEDLRPQIVAKVVQSFSDSPEILYGWLRLQGYLDEAMAVGKRLVESGKFNYLAPTIDLAVRLKALDEGEALLEKYGAQVSQFDKSVASIRLAYGAGDREAAATLWDHTWEQAVAEMQNQHMLLLCQLAASIDEPSRTQLAADRVLGQGLSLPKELIVHLAALELKEEDVSGARFYMEHAAILYPDNLGFQNDAIYLTVLLGESSPTHITRMLNVTSKDPGNEFFRFTLALVQMSNGQFSSAKNTLESLDFEDGIYQPASWGIWAGALFKTGHTEQAQRALARCEQDKLFPAEYAYLSQFWD